MSRSTSRVITGWSRVLRASQLPRPRNPFWVVTLVLIATLGGAAPTAHATEPQALLQMAAGRAACRGGRYAKGIQALLDGAVALQRANPSHPANRRWLPQVRRCLKTWIRKTGAQCRRTGDAAALDTLSRIQKTMRYLAVPGAKRLLKGVRTRCLADIVRVRARQCMQAPARPALVALGALGQTLKHHGATRPLLRRLSAGRDRCAKRWILDLESRCKTAPQVTTLREMGRGVTILSGATRRTARTAYVHCAQALARTGWALCQARRYLKGRAILKEAVGRYGFFGVQDPGFIHTAKTRWLPRCGTWRISGYFVARARVQGVRLQVAARLAYVLARGGRGARSVQGALRVRYSALRGVRPGCRVLLAPQDGRYPMQGQESASASGRQLRLRRDGGLPAIPATEELQVTCGAATPQITKLRLVSGLITAAGLLAPTLKAQPGSRRAVRYRGTLPGGLKASLAGTLVVTRIDGAAVPARRQPSRTGR